MTQDLLIPLIENTRRRAQLYGAETTPEARRRYYRELAAIDALLGQCSSFERLGS